MLRSRPILVAAGAALLGVLFLVAVGVGPADAAVLVALVTMQAAAGAYLWVLGRGRLSGDERLDGLEVLGGGLALGSGLSVLSGVLLDAAMPGHVGWLAPSAAALLIWGVRALRGANQAPIPAWRRSSLTGFAVAIGLGLVSVALNSARYPLGTLGPWTSFHRDMLYFEGLSTSVSVFGPSDSIFMSGADVRYHWFAYAWAGQLAHTADAAPFVALTRLLPIVALIGCAALVASWTARLVNRTPATVLAAVLLVVGGYLGAANGTILNYDSPSQALTTLWLLGAFVASLAFLRDRSSWWSLATAVALFAVTAGGKISTAAVGLVPLILVALVATVRREPWVRRAWALAALAMVAVAVVYVVVISGSASAGDLQLLSLQSRASSIQGLDSSKGTRGVLIGTLTLVLAMTGRWWGLAWLVGEARWRWRPDVVLGVGLVLVGIAPVVLLSQGVNETWFALAASAPLAVLSAAGVAVAWERSQSRVAMWSSVALGVLVALVVPVFWIPNVTDSTSPRFWGPWAGFAVALVGALCVAVVAGRPHERLRLVAAVGITALVVAASLARVSPVVSARVHQQPVAGADVAAVTGAGAEGGASITSVGPVMGPPATLLQGSPPDRTSWTSAEADAAAFLRANTGESDIVVTNETTSFLVPALAGRLTYLSGAPYQGLYGSTATVGDIPARIETSLAFTRAGDPEAFERLCAAGVTWGWIARDGSPLESWEPYAHVAFANDAVAVIQLDRSRCA